MKVDLAKILACPRCKKSLRSVNYGKKCTSCKTVYKKGRGVWHLLFVKEEETKKSMKQYDLMHQNHFGNPNDGSYEILASIARGNKTLDIACGEGDLEKLSPETVALEFSINALKKAKRKGAKHLVLADAHNLPFKNDSFDIAISSGNLEHFANPQKALDEMVRVSKIQILIVHQHLPLPFSSIIYGLLVKILKIKNQPIEKPIGRKDLEKMLSKTKTHIVYKGVWTLPVNYGRVIKFLPELKNLPSSSFVASFKR